MGRALRWIGIAFGVLVVIGIVAYAAVYVLSERVRQRIYDVPAVALTLPTDPASIEEGQRLVTIRGCMGGCHGKDGEGIVFFDQPMIGRVVAPGLGAAARKYGDAELAGIIRHGVRPDGRSVIIMPSEAFAGLTDADLARIIAFLRTLPAITGPSASVSLGPIGRIGLVTGKFHTVAELIATTVPPPEAATDQAKVGRYLARTVCAECHGTSLRGDANPDFTSPDLRVVAAYSPEAFSTLMRTGESVSGRDLGMMREMSRDHLSQLTDAEIAALYSYLRALPAAARN